MARDWQNTVVVSLTKVYEIKPTKGGRRTYLLIDNQSTAPIKFDHSVAPSDFNGEILPAGSRYERDNHPPQTTIFVKGTVSTDQLVNIGQGFEV